MRQSNPQQRRLCFRQFTTAVCLLLLTATATVAEAPTQIEAPAISAPEKPTEESIARELLEIQQRLGGSIVADRQSLQEYTPFTAVNSTRRQASPRLANPTAVEVESLRDAAWQLDQSAERLERSELFKQADALRNLAQQFRLDARAIRAQSSKKDADRAIQP